MLFLFCLLFTIKGIIITIEIKKHQQFNIINDTLILKTNPLIKLKIKLK